MGRSTSSAAVITCARRSGGWLDRQLPDDAARQPAPRIEPTALTQNADPLSHHHVAFISTRTNFRAPKSWASAQLVGIARETEEVAGAAVGARHPRWFYIASNRADRPGLAIV